MKPSEILRAALDELNQAERACQQTDPAAALAAINRARALVRAARSLTRWPESPEPPATPSTQK